MKMSPKLITLFMLSLLIFSSISHAARPDPSFRDAKTQHEVVGEVDQDLCNGVGEEECTLMRRTLEAHIDYLYTQKKKP